jgi:hypothetical protein
MRQASVDWAEQHSDWSAAHRRALEWLVSVQQPDGSWAAADTDAAVAADRIRKVAVTAVAVLALESGLSTMRTGPHRASIRSAIKWLLEQQAADGWFVDASGPDAALAQALAATAVTETYVMSAHRPLRVRALASLKLFGEAERAPDGPLWSSMPSALAVCAWRRLPEADRAAELIREVALLPGLIAAQLGRSGTTAAGVLPAVVGPLPGAQAPADFAVLMALSGKGWLVPSNPAVVAAGANMRAVPPRLGRKGELLDAVTLWFATDAAFTVGSEAQADWQRLVERTVVPMQAGSGPDEGSFTYGCGLALLRDRVPETALTALALAVPWFRVGRGD